MTIDAVVQRIFKDCRYRARKKGVAFDIERDWIRDRILSGKCEITGLRFQIGNRAPGKSAGKRAPSIDRRIPEDGYTMDNCRIVVWQYNVAKSQWGDQDVFELAKSIMENNR